MKSGRQEKTEWKIKWTCCTIGIASKELIHFSRKKKKTSGGGGGGGVNVCSYLLSLA